MEAQGGASSEGEAEEGRQLVGTSQVVDKWQARLQVSLDGEGRPVSGAARTANLLYCSSSGEAAVARDLAVHWLRSAAGAGEPLPGSHRQNVPTATYRRQSAGLLQPLASIGTLAQLLAHLRGLRDGGALASTAAALGLASAAQQEEGTGAAAFKGVAPSGKDTFYTRVRLHDDAGRPQPGATHPQRSIVSGCSAPEAAAAWDLGVLWRRHHSPNNTDTVFYNFTTGRSVDWSQPPAAHCTHSM